MALEELRWPKRHLYKKKIRDQLQKEIQEKQMPRKTEAKATDKAVVSLEEDPRGAQGAEVKQQLQARRCEVAAEEEDPERGLP